MAKIDINEIKKEVLHYKKILNLLGIEIKLDKIKNNICYTRFFDKDRIIITTNAIVWNKGNWKNFKTIKAHITTNVSLNNEEIKWLLLKEIYTKSIKYF